MPPLGGILTLEMVVMWVQGRGKQRVDPAKWDGRHGRHGRCTRTGRALDAPRLLPFAALAWHRHHPPSFIEG